MTECQRCGGRAELFLCPRCVNTLEKQLSELPWWLGRLTETAHGRVRMSDNGGRRSARRRDLDGDTELAACIEILPNNRDGDLEKARRDREKRALAHALATGRINARASELLGQVADGLAYWVRVLCEARGLPSPAAAGASRIYGGIWTLWLRENVGAIAASEDAADIVSDVEGWLGDIARVVNRPLRWWSLGDCPADVRVEGPAQHGKPDPTAPCNAELPRVPERTEHVTCRECGTRQTVMRVLMLRKYAVEHGEPQTRKELVRYNRELPTEFQVPARTLRDWLDRGALAPCDLTDEGDPLYSWVDVRLLMLESKHASVNRRAAR